MGSVKVVRHKRSISCGGWLWKKDSRRHSAQLGSEEFGNVRLGDVVGILRLRLSFALLSSLLAQDDNADGQQSERPRFGLHKAWGSRFRDVKATNMGLPSVRKWGMSGFCRLRFCLDFTSFSKPESVDTSGVRE